MADSDLGIPVPGIPTIVGTARLLNYLRKLAIKILSGAQHEKAARREEARRSPKLYEFLAHYYKRVKGIEVYRSTTMPFPFHVLSSATDQPRPWTLTADFRGQDAIDPFLDQAGQIYLRELHRREIQPWDDPTYRLPERVNDFETADVCI